MDVKHNSRYEATVKLKGLQSFAPNSLIVAELVKYGFTDVKVEGSGSERVAVATWAGETQENVSLPEQVSNVREVSSTT
jgi:hypothetical protein